MLGRNGFLSIKEIAVSTPFVHLHIHTHYSPLDGIVVPAKMLARAQELGQTAMAITDHGVMYGALDFYTAALKKNMKPIIGFEAYIAPGSRKEKTGYNHLILLARNMEGYRNLCRLCSEGFLSGFYRHPRIDWELLQEHAEGVACLSACLQGRVPRLLLEGNFDEAERVALQHEELFGKGNYFIEIMDNGLPDQKRLLPLFRKLSDKTGIPLVATCDSHYLYPEDEILQDIKICILTGKKLADENRLHAESGVWLKSGDEMLAALPGFEDAIANTLRVADICNLELPLRKGFHLPKLQAPDGMDSAQFMRKICLDGLRKHYGDPLPDEVTERFEKECSVIEKMGFPDYFNLVWDVVNFARTNGIPVGPGRGSAAGSIVAYGMGITSLDPLKYNLFFERFLNEGRNEMPDIDLDFDKERRHEVVEHIIERHGADHCAKIITFSCLQLKGAIKDVGRVMDIPGDVTSRLSKIIPTIFKPAKGKSPLQAALEDFPELKKEYDKDETTKTLLDRVGRLDGVMRGTGQHAAGVLVCDQVITQYMPLALAAGKDAGEATTQCEMKGLEEFGLCKIDVLGLETLSLIKNAVDIIRATHGVEVDIDHVPLDDHGVFEMLGRGDAKGVFQFESDGFRNLLYRLKPDVFEDLIAAVAIFRPGPLQFLDSFIARKHGLEPIEYLHPKMEPILKETYGLILYQEQVQALARNLAYFTLSEGDLMRRAMGKKKQEIMDKYKAQFVAQSGKLPVDADGKPLPGHDQSDIVPEKVAQEIYSQIEKFAGYGFNKSHSACYAFIAYQTAWLKCHYPCEYMAALLTTNRGDSDKIVLYTKDAADIGMRVLPASINKSMAAFAPEDGAIRFGLTAIKGVGDYAGEHIVQERLANGPYVDIYDFCSRVDLRSVNKGTIEALIKSGAMDELGGHRAQLVAALEGAMRMGANKQKSKATGQMGLFGGASVPAPVNTLPDVAPWPALEELRLEKSVLGFYSSSHPLGQYASRIQAFATRSIKDLEECDHNAHVIIGGLVTSFTIKKTKSGKRIGILGLEDADAQAECVVFERKESKKEDKIVLEDIKPLVPVDAIVFADVRVDKRQDKLSLQVDKIIPLDLAEEQLAEQAVVKVRQEDLTDQKLQALQALTAANKGDTKLCFRVTSPSGSLELRAGRNHSIRARSEVIDGICSIFGQGAISLIGRAGQHTQEVLA